MRLAATRSARRPGSIGPLFRVSAIWSSAVVSPDEIASSLRVSQRPAPSEPSSRTCPRDKLTGAPGERFDPPAQTRERPMEKRRLGRTGLDVSLLGFGCGAVGGLMVKGAAADQERAVSRALELGINYFDTASMYGDGESERNLGRVLKSLKPNIYVGTKVRLSPPD